MNSLRAVLARWLPFSVVVAYVALFVPADSIGDKILTAIGAAIIIPALAAIALILAAVAYANAANISFKEKKELDIDSPEFGGGWLALTLTFCVMADLLDSKGWGIF